MSRYTFSFRNMTFGENSNLNMPSRHYSSKSSGSNHLNHANLVDIPQIQIPPIIESNQNSQENPNLPSQHQITSQMIYEDQYPVNNDIFEVPPEYQNRWYRGQNNFSPASTVFLVQMICCFPKFYRVYFYSKNLVIFHNL